MWHVVTLVEHRVETAAGHMVGGESVYILSLTWLDTDWYYWIPVSFPTQMKTDEGKIKQRGKFKSVLVHEWVNLVKCHDRPLLHLSHTSSHPFYLIQHQPSIPAILQMADFQAKHHSVLPQQFSINYGNGISTIWFKMGGRGGPKNKTETNKNRSVTI